MLSDAAKSVHAAQRGSEHMIRDSVLNERSDNDPDGTDSLWILGYSSCGCQKGEKNKTNPFMLNLSVLPHCLVEPVTVVFYRGFMV